jgi:hypothetical protein
MIAMAKVLRIARSISWSPDTSFQERDQELGSEFRAPVYSPSGALVELNLDVLGVLAAFGEGNTVDAVARRYGMDQGELSDLVADLERRGFLTAGAPAAGGELAPMFLLAAHSCGGTLARWFLDSHPRLACPSPHRLGVVAREMMYKAAKLDAFYALKIDRDGATRLLGSVLSDLLTFHARLRQKDATVWASRDNDLCLQFLDDISGGAGKFLIIVRHPLDAAHTSVQRCQAEGWHAQRLIDLVEEHATPHVAYAHYWTQVYRRIRLFREVHPQTTLVVRYEDLVRSPQVELGRAFEHFGVTWDPSLITQAFSRPHEVLEGGWESFALMSETSVRSDQIDLWRRWDPAQVRQLLPIIGDELEAWGYSAK